MVLICPSVKGLQKMVDICKVFGIEYDVAYNEKKTTCICFSKTRNPVNFKVHLNDTVLKCVESFKHIGITMSWNMKDDTDISKKRGVFIGEANYVIGKYKSLTSEVQSRMLQAYCSNVYGCETWLLQNPIIQSIGTSWNISHRKIWDLPYNAHCYILPGLSEMNTINIQIYRRFLKLYESMRKSKNPIVSLIANWAVSNARSIISKIYQ